jgi:hypothetical protein
MQHRLTEGGMASQRLYHAVNYFAALALIPIAVSLGIDLFIVIQQHFGTGAGLGAGLLFSALALSVWFGLAWLRQRHDLKEKSAMKVSGKTPLHAKVEQMLTEARVLLPGAQALLGFQMAVMFTSAFEGLPALSKLLHVAALCCIALAIILLMAPAAFHRLAYFGEDSEEFHSLGTRFVVAAAVPLALGITLELYVGTAKASGSSGLAAAAAISAAVVLTFLWFVQPLLLRAKERAS